MLTTLQVLVAANFPLQHRHQRVILHKICHFEPIPKFELSEKFSCGSPFAKMPKMTDFSCLGKLRSRCVGSVISGTEAFSLNYLIRTFIPSEFQRGNSCSWPIAAFQKVH